MEKWRQLIGKCGAYCGGCRLYVLKACKSCSKEESKCPYLGCEKGKDVGSCGQCEGFPCQNHYGPMAVYSERYLDWKKQEIAKRGQHLQRVRAS